MTIEPTTPDIEPADEAWHEIEDLVEEIAGLARVKLSPREFYTELLDRAVRAVSAVGGAVWSARGGEPLRLEYEIHLDQTGLGELAAAAQGHQRLLGAVVDSGEAKIVPPGSGLAEEAEPANTTGLLLVLCPVEVDGQTVAVMELFGRAKTPAPVQRGYLRFLGALAELASEFYRNRQLRDLRGREALWQQFAQFCRRIHRSLNLQATAYEIANEGRRLVGCDRVSVLLRRGSKYRLQAVSGAETFDRRATSVRCLEALAAAAMEVRDPLWHGEETTELPPEIERPLHAYLDESHARLLGVLPLDEPGQPLGALVVERFEAGSDAGLRERAMVVCEHAAIALRNALELRDVPLFVLWRLLAGVRWLARGRRLPKTLLVLAAVGAAVAALVLVPADFRIDARGEMQPVERREVFAPSDGVVHELYARNEKPVAQGDVLLVLRNPELELESSRLAGETEVARKRLDAVRAERLNRTLAGAEDRRHASELTAEEEELKQMLSNLAGQREILDRQRQELTVTSPLDGQVLTWNVQELLDARPVARGQTLMTMADLGQRWVLEIRVPDHHVGHVLDARREQGKDLEVSYILATDPGKRYRGQIEKIAARTETDEAGSPTVLLTVRIEPDDVREPRPGASVIAKIHCGRRSVGYVWLHDLYDAIRSRLFF